jgi:hypothetical protein
MKAKDINIYSIFSRTYKKKMFSFMDFGEIGILKKGKTIRQVSNVYHFPNHTSILQPKRRVK